MSTRVLHLISGYNGGIASFVKNKARALVGTDVKFDVLAFHDAPNSFKTIIDSMGGDIYQMPNPKKFGYRAFISSVNAVMSNGNYDLIHCHFRGLRALPFYFATKSNGINRFALHAHSSLKSKRKDSVSEKIEKRINTFIAKEKITCSNLASQAYFTQKAVETEDIVFIPNSINTAPFLEVKDSSVLKSQILGDEYKNHLILGNVARFEYQKNHEFIIKIAVELRKVKKNFLIILVGEGNRFEEIKELVSENYLDNNILFMGHRNDVPDLYKIMDYFLLPSRYEGLPTVAIEAQASGLHSLISDEIAEETDLGMNLVEFLPIVGDSPEKVWVQNIMSNYHDIPSADLRYITLKEKKFTNEESARLYYDYLKYDD